MAWCSMVGIVRHEIRDHVQTSLQVPILCFVLLMYQVGVDVFVEKK